MNNINQAKKIGDGISSSSEIASTVSASLSTALTGSIQDAIDASLAGFSGGSGDLSAYQSTTPTITTTAVDPVERSTITVIISDYNAANEYTIDVTGARVPLDKAVVNPFIWSNNLLLVLAFSCNC